MRLAFAGTGAFAVPALERLAEVYGLELVITQPDRPAGRGLEPTPPPVKRKALELGLPVLQPKSINKPEVVAHLRALNLDLLVVAAFGQLLRSEVLHLPRLGCVNIHASLLPKYRGAAPVHWAIIHGEQETGVTTFVLDEGMDTGPVLLQVKTEIGPEETAGELERRLAALGADLIVETIEGYTQGRIVPQPQPAAGTLAPKLTKEDGRIRWEWPAQRIHNLVRGTQPWPGAHTTLRDILVKVHKTQLVERPQPAVGPGTILPDKRGLFVATGDGVLEVLLIQPAGCRVITGRDFVNGYCRVPGMQFL